MVKCFTNKCDPELLSMSIVSTVTGFAGGMAKVGKLTLEGISYGTSIYGTGRSFMEDKRKSSEC